MPLRAALIAAAAGLAVLAGCGDDGDSGSASPDGEQFAVETIAAAPDRVAEAGSYRVEGTVGLETEASPFVITLEGDFVTDPVAASLDTAFEGFGGDGTAYETRIVDGVLYLQIGALFDGLGGPVGELPAGVEWVEIDAPELAGDLSGTAGTDPTATLESLRGVSDDVTEIGPEEIRGVETTHYRARVDPDRAQEQVEDQLSELPESQREAIEDGLDALGDKPLDVDVWIDDDGLVRRQQSTFTAVIAREETEGVTTLEYFDYGADILVEPPPPDETATFEEIFGGSLEELQQLGSVLA